MAHPLMFDDADPLLARVRALALAFPDAAEKVSHGHPAFFTTKVFAYYGGSQRIDGEWVRHEQSLLVLTDPTERAALARGRPLLRARLPRRLRVGRPAAGRAAATGPRSASSSTPRTGSPPGRAGWPGWTPQR